ncbi:MAG: lytic transglycosylase domain-containing protein [Magnetococcales bacterium]|nr:lytic transglycosylase domain-containing protein [Magnetococcales bacterium]
MWATALTPRITSSSATATPPGTDCPPVAVSSRPSGGFPDEVSKGRSGFSRRFGGHLLFCLGLLLAGWAEAKTPSWLPMIQQVAREEQVDPALLEAVVAVESSFDPLSVSPKGAAGLTQLMPGTAHDMGVRNPFHPEQNLRGGAKYLRKMLDQFNNLGLALAGYNAGPGAVLKYKGVPPYPETRRYVKKVMEYYQAVRLDGKHRTPPPAAFEMVRRFRSSDGRIILVSRAAENLKAPTNMHITVRRASARTPDSASAQPVRQVKLAALGDEMVMPVRDSVPLHAISSYSTASSIPILRLSR